MFGDLKSRIRAMDDDLHRWFSSLDLATRQGKVAALLGLASFIALVVLAFYLVSNGTDGGFAFQVPNRVSEGRLPQASIR